MPELEPLQQLIDRLTQSHKATELAEIQQTLFQLADAIEIRLWDLKDAE
jgi:hypothetical protein